MGMKAGMTEREAMLSTPADVSRLFGYYLEFSGLKKSEDMSLLLGGEDDERTD